MYGPRKAENAACKATAVHYSSIIWLKHPGAEKGPMLTNNVDEELQGELEALALYTAKKGWGSLKKLWKNELNLKRTTRLLESKIMSLDLKKQIKVEGPHD